MLKNTTDSWGSLARGLHWLIALWIVGQFAFGLWMTDVPPKDERAYYYALHASSGWSLLMLMIVRVVWRFVNPTPGPLASVPGWERTLAKLGVYAIYVAIFATLLAGVFLADAFQTSLAPKIFGVIPAPVFFGPDEATKEVLEDRHETLAYIVIVLAAIHAGAAIYNHVFRKNGLLIRMVPGRVKA